ncbi:hypothetical protein MUK42_27382 [Musa troglodytarum]|uniref:Uncharacterized protein n=1 Tax=Musa troglodytarum TaxID=320322 RepID=A0A9E7F9W7_9LILI|nr:hypothetical protein MUK42_27382 [Musa troglodytarum]
MGKTVSLIDVHGEGQVLPVASFKAATGRSLVGAVARGGGCEVSGSLVVSVSADLLYESWPARHMRSLRCSWPSHRASRRTMLRLSRTRRLWLPLRHPQYHRSPACSLQPPSDHLQSLNADGMECCPVEWLK